MEDHSAPAPKMPETEVSTELTGNSEGLFLSFENPAVVGLWRSQGALPLALRLKAIITYEEFHPYGSTAWWAEKSGIQVSRKRYRYTGMEKDEETGLSYHNARYYMTWLGRWERPDPIGLGGGFNRFAYTRVSQYRKLRPL
jgi:RHS repeat-associated protein